MTDHWAKERATVASLVGRTITRAEWTESLEYDVPGYVRVWLDDGRVVEAGDFPREVHLMDVERCLHCGGDHKELMVHDDREVGRVAYCPEHHNAHAWQLHAPAPPPAPPEHLVREIAAICGYPLEVFREHAEWFEWPGSHYGWRWEPKHGRDAMVAAADEWEREHDPKGYALRKSLEAIEAGGDG